MDVNDFEGRRKRRIPMIAQLAMGDDDDLIAWLMSFRTGEKQAAIKEAVRRGIAEGESIRVIPGKAGRPRRLPDEPTPAQLPPDAANRIAQLETENRRLQQQMQEWIAFFNNRFEQVIAGGGLDTATEPIEAVPDLEADIKQARAGNLGRAQW